MEERGPKFERSGPNAFGLVNGLGWSREPAGYCVSPLLVKQKDFSGFLQQRKAVQNIRTEYKVFS